MTVLHIKTVISATALARTAFLGLRRQAPLYTLLTYSPIPPFPLNKPTLATWIRHTATAPPPHKTNEKLMSRALEPPRRPRTPSQAVFWEPRFWIRF